MTIKEIATDFSISVNDAIVNYVNLPQNQLRLQTPSDTNGNFTGDQYSRYKSFSFDAANIAVFQSPSVNPSLTVLVPVVFTVTGTTTSTDGNGNDAGVVLDARNDLLMPTLLQINYLYIEGHWITLSSETGGLPIGQSLPLYDGNGYRWRFKSISFFGFSDVVPMIEQYPDYMKSSMPTNYISISKAVMSYYIKFTYSRYQYVDQPVGRSVISDVGSTLQSEEITAFMYRPFYVTNYPAVGLANLANSPIINGFAGGNTSFMYGSNSSTGLLNGYVNGAAGAAPTISAGTVVNIRMSGDFKPWSCSYFNNQNTTNYDGVGNLAIWCQGSVLQLQKIGLNEVNNQYSQTLVLPPRVTVPMGSNVKVRAFTYDIWANQEATNVATSYTSTSPNQYDYGPITYFSTNATKEDSIIITSSLGLKIVTPSGVVLADYALTNSVTEPRSSVAYSGQVRGYHETNYRPGPDFALVHIECSGYTARFWVLLSANSTVITRLPNDAGAYRPVPRSGEDPLDQSGTGLYAVGGQRYLSCDSTGLVPAQYTDTQGVHTAPPVPVSGTPTLAKKVVQSIRSSLPLTTYVPYFAVREAQFVVLEDGSTALVADTGDTPILRLTQRDDGRGTIGHARIQTAVGNRPTDQDSTIRLGASPSVYQ